jgi:hypothetical protein
LTTIFFFKEIKGFLVVHQEICLELFGGSETSTILILSSLGLVLIGYLFPVYFTGRQNCMNIYTSRILMLECCSTEELLDRKVAAPV